MSIADQVRPHASVLRASAAAMEAAGIGTDAQAGHVKVLRSMADQLETEAAAGRLPLSLNSSAGGGQIGLAALAAAGTAANGMDAHSLARIQAHRMTDPRLDRLMRDLKLEAGAGSYGGMYTVHEIEERLTSANQRMPEIYRNVNRLEVKLTLNQVGVMANVA